MNVLQTLPAQIRPDCYAANEAIRSKNKIADDEKFGAFVAKNPQGFFLLGKRARYNIGQLSPKRDYSNIGVDELGEGLSEADAVAILKALASAGSIFSFAANSDEYLHRNRYVRKLGVTQLERWIGRDLTKYLPGIYWLTLLPKKYADSVARLTKSLDAEATQIDADHWLIKAFDDPNEWQRYASRIDQWLSGQPEFFSKLRILEQLDAAPNIEALREAGRKWP